MTPTTATPNAKIWVSTDGTDPKAANEHNGLPILVGTNTRLRAKAVAPGMTASAIAEADYVISYPVQTASPVQMTPSAGQYNSPFALGLSTATAGATICYTDNGSTPSCHAGACTGASLTYSAGSPIPVQAPTGGGPLMVKALACGSDLKNSSVTEASYTFRVAAPSTAPPSGIVPPNQQVLISTATSPVGPNSPRICYTTNNTAPMCSADGKACLNGTPIVGSSGNVTVVQDTTYRAIACRADYEPSEERTFTYDVQ